MKILLLSLLSLFTIQVCTGQSAPKASARPAASVQFTPPVIKKDVDAKPDDVKFTPPVIKKNKLIKKKPATQFTPPVIVKDKS